MVIGVGLMAMTIEDRQDANKAPRLEDAGRIHSVASAMVVAYETAAVTEDIHKRKFRRLGAAMMVREASQNRMSFDEYFTRQLTAAEEAGNGLEVEELVWRDAFLDDAITDINRSQGTKLHRRSVLQERSLKRIDDYTAAKVQKYSGYVSYVIDRVLEDHPDIVIDARAVDESIMVQNQNNVQGV